MLAITGLGMASLVRDGQLVGRLLETLVAAQLRAEIATSARPPHLYHLRNRNGDREVDLILEYPVVGWLALR